MSIDKNNISDSFESNVVSFIDRDININELPWNKHPKFEGVYLKHLIQGNETNGAISCHLVKIEPNCTIGEHIHEGKIEIHEVIEGNGTCYLSDRKISYRPGSVALLPADIVHKVSAGDDGLYLLAKFSPALL